MNPESSFERARRHERAGDWNAAADLFADAFQSAVVERHAANLVDALRGIGRMRAYQSRYEEAEELATLAELIARRHGLGAAAARAVNIMGFIYYDQHELERAREYFAQALVEARALHDDELVALACANLGAIGTIFGQWDEARLILLEAIAAAVRALDIQSIGGAYNNLGAICRHSGDLLESELHLRRGIEIFGHASSPPVLCRLHLQLAETLLLMHRRTEAEAAASAAEGYLLHLDDKEAAASSLRFRAKLDRTAGSWQKAEATIKIAISLAAEAGSENEQAEAMEELANIYHVGGQFDEARRVANIAATHYQKQHAIPQLARVQQSLRDWTRTSSMVLQPRDRG